MIFEKRRRTIKYGYLGKIPENNRLVRIRIEEIKKKEKMGINKDSSRRQALKKAKIIRSTKMVRYQKKKRKKRDSLRN